jgi:tRNA(fMet)-specific endonuclease VapC
VRYLLDTNACIAILNGTSRKVIDRFKAESPATVGVCSVVRAELEFGARKSTRTAAVLANLTKFLAPLESLPFDDACASQYGAIRAEIERLGRPIGGNDLLIAAIARTHDVVVVTRNVKEFSRVAGLRVEDWSRA